MYDPEWSLMREGLMKQLYASTENLRQLQGASHPLVKLCESIDVAFDIVAEMDDDYDNCFDDNKRNEISKEIRAMLEQLTDIFDKIIKLTEVRP